MANDFKELMSTISNRELIKSIYFEADKFDDFVIEHYKLELIERNLTQNEIDSLKLEINSEFNNINKKTDNQLDLMHTIKILITPFYFTLFSSINFFNNSISKELLKWSLYAFIFQIMLIIFFMFLINYFL